MTFFTYFTLLSILTLLTILTMSLQWKIQYPIGHFCLHILFMNKEFRNIGWKEHQHHETRETVEAIFGTPKSFEEKKTHLSRLNDWLTDWDWDIRSCMLSSCYTVWLFLERGDGGRLVQCDAISARTKALYSQMIQNRYSLYIHSCFFNCKLKIANTMLLFLILFCVFCLRWKNFQFWPRWSPIFASVH